MAIGIIIGLLIGVTFCSAFFGVIIWSATHSRSETNELQSDWNKSTMEALERNHEAFENIANAIWQASIKK